jgi:tryptophanyl-tRNA synthetase
MRKRIVSGIQPSGILHIGNYLGAIKQWVKYQENLDNECVFFIADLHSMTAGIFESKLSKKDKDSFESRSILTAASLLGCGLDPKKVVLFNQSHVSEHMELFWLLNCISPMSKLNNMIQYKEKKRANEDNINCGLYNYPVLMTADILLYKANEVPVGEDQVQHIELARDLTYRLNSFCGKKLFPIPNYVISKGNRVMSLLNGKTKMSKSDRNVNSSINLLDSSDDIKTKILKSRTDSESEITYDKEKRPEVANLINIYAEFEDKEHQEVVEIFKGANLFEFKQAIVASLEKNFVPLCEKTRSIMKDNDYIYDVLSTGRKRAKDIASKSMFELKSHINMLL